MTTPQGIAFALPGLHAKSFRTRRTSEYLTSGIPLLKFLPNGLRNHLVAMLCEFVGTFLFLFFAYSGTQVATTQSQNAGSGLNVQGLDPPQLLYVSLCFGSSLAVNAWVFFRVSGGLFNPAVSLGMSVIGALPWSRSLLLVIAQLTGGIAAAATVSILFPGPLNVGTMLGQGTTTTQGLFIEMFLTAQLVFTTFMLAAQEHRGTFIAPIGIGLSLFVAEMTGVYFTGGAVNPARSFGPCVVLQSFEHYHWIYWFGPFLGALLASGLYKFIKLLELDNLPLSQDRDVEKHQSFDPNRDMASPQGNFPSAEPPVVPTHQIQAFGGLDRADASDENIHNEQVSRSSSSSDSHASRISAVEGNDPPGESHGRESVGHIYIDESRLSQRSPEAEVARISYVPRTDNVRHSFVPRTAGRS